MVARRASTPEDGDTAAVDVEALHLAGRLDAEYRPLGSTAPPPVLVGYDVHGATAGGPGRLRLHGRHFGVETTVWLNGEALAGRLVNDTELEAELPAHVDPLGPGLAEVVVSNGPPEAIRGNLAVEAGKPTILGVSPDPEVPKAGEAFSLNLRFRVRADAPAVLVRLHAIYPDGEQRSGDFIVSEREGRTGRKRLGRFVSGGWGTMKVRVTVIASDGHAATSFARFEVVPANPVQVTVYPSDSAFTWKGAVRYVPAEDRYYCHARAVFSNGNDHPVTIGRRVDVRVRDGGSTVTTFGFDLDSSYTVGANSSRTLYFHTRHRNTDTADIFENFGDVTIEYTFSTSEGNKTGSAVFVMMGQVNVACNFVGDFSAAERAGVRSLVLGRAASVYQQVDLTITSAPILEIPRSHGDWSRYRDIRFDSCKNGVSSDEAEALRSGWSSPDSFARHVDLWFVESFSGESCAAGTGGFSPRPGPASKSGGNSGCVIDVKDLDILNSTWGSNVLGLVVAHELGHYLGLPHITTSGNFMLASTDGSNTGITWDQHNTVDDHDWVERLNP